MSSTDNLRMLHLRAVEARQNQGQAALSRPGSAASGAKLAATHRLVSRLRAALTPGRNGAARTASPYGRDR